MSVVVPSNGPVPDVSAIETLTLGPKPVLESLPNWSCDFKTGWDPKIAPVLAVPGCVVKASLVAEPTASDRVPKLLPPEPSALLEVVRPLIDAEPPPDCGRKSWPLASGVPAVGRTWSPFVLPMVN